ncbi:hypothetical protein AAY473_013676 [Plecturocebus cupreus]
MQVPCDPTRVVDETLVQPSNISSSSNGNAAKPNGFDFKGDDNSHSSPSSTNPFPHFWPPKDCLTSGRLKRHIPIPFSRLVSKSFLLQLLNTMGNGYLRKGSPEQWGFTELVRLLLSSGDPPALAFQSAGISGPANHQPASCLYRFACALHFIFIPWSTHEKSTDLDQQKPQIQQTREALLYLETRFPHGQDGLKLLTSGDPSTSASQSAGIPGMSHHAGHIFYHSFRDQLAELFQKQGESEVHLQYEGVRRPHRRGWTLLGQAANQKF